MSTASKTACPKCGFAYAWNGTNCIHCQHTATSGFAEPPKSTFGGDGETATTGVDRVPMNKTSLTWELLIAACVVVLLLVGSLVELGHIKNRAIWVGIRDFTTAYLIGSIVVGIMDVIGETVVIRNEGRLTKFSNWILGCSWIWIPVSAGINLNMLLNEVPQWLPASYLVFFVASAGWGIIQHWQFFKGLMKAEYDEKNVPLVEYPQRSKLGSLIDIAFGIAFACASCVLLFW